MQLIGSEYNTSVLSYGVLCFVIFLFFLILLQVLVLFVLFFCLLNIKNIKMNVYEFEKSLLKRMEESRNVLQCKGAPVPASEVREEWACHVELIIEPAGKFDERKLCFFLFTKIEKFCISFSFSFIQLVQYFAQ